MPITLDKTDARILRLLKRDGRISNLKLAEDVHLSPTAVLERVKRLQREGVILGYQAHLNVQKAGMGFTAYVEVQLDRTGADLMQTFHAAVQTRPEILECHLIAGSFDYLLKVWARDATAWRDRVASVVGSLPGVRDSRSYNVTQQLKHGAALAC
ncbi:MAG: AsnC family transcriptional regulator [Betaproteobacteria bacterium]|nr:MAG: AsnC family transcriptional regulator [Betaproteobacteria bacterium]TMH33040.1 MAG: AsnC family transcriptional regulator [Betaproteobacteria bacterium]